MRWKPWGDNGGIQAAEENFLFTAAVSSPGAKTWNLRVQREDATTADFLRGLEGEGSAKRAARRWLNGHGLKPTRRQAVVLWPCGHATLEPASDLRVSVACYKDNIMGNNPVKCGKCRKETDFGRLRIRWWSQT